MNSTFTMMPALILPLTKIVRYLTAVILSLSFVCGMLHSQPIRFERISTEEGLPDATIICMIKDRLGFMWFGTGNGLARYDGYSFRQFTSGPANTKNLTNGLVYALLEDRMGQIWVGTVGGGLNKFDPATETFTYYQHDPKNPQSLSHDQVYSLFEDRSGRLWIGTTGGLDYFDRERQTFAHFDPDDISDPITNKVTSIYERSVEPGVLWLGTLGGGLKRFDCQTHGFTHYRNDPRSDSSLSDNQIWFVHGSSESANILWIGTINGLNKFDIARERFMCFKNDPRDPASLSHNGVRTMLEDRSGILWIGTSGGGLNRFDPGKERFVSYSSDPRDTRSLSNNNVVTLFEDECNVHWAGTRDGLNRFTSPKEDFVIYQNDPHNPRSLSNNFLWSLYEDKSGVLWIASGLGLNRFDRETETFTCYKHDPDNLSSLRNNLVRTIYEDRRGILWVGNVNGMLHRFDRRTGKSKAIQLLVNQSNQKDNDILSMLEDRNGTFWIGTTEGLQTFDREKWISKPITIGPLGQDQTQRYQVNALYEDNDGTLWIGTSTEGLLAFQSNSGTVTVYRNDSANTHSLGNNNVAFVTRDKSGTLWVATRGGGLNRFDDQKKEFNALTKDNVLPYSIIVGFLEDNSGNFWFSMGKGLCRFNPVTAAYRIFDAREVRQGSGFNTRSFCKSKTGAMYFGGVNGLDVFYPDSIHDNAHVPPIFLTSIKIHEKEFLTDTATAHLRTIRLSHTDNYLSFEFSALDFKDQKYNKYAYMLEGLEREWISCDTRRYAGYTGLEPGTYVFRVKGSNNNGVWNTQGAALTIVIAPPWWRTTWAYLFYVLSTLGTIYAFYRYQIARLSLQHQMEIEHLEGIKLKEIDQVKTRFFANVSHELRTPLTLIEGPMKALLSGDYTGDVKEVYQLILRNSRRLLLLVNQLLDLSKIEAGSLKLQARKYDFLLLVKGVVACFESLASQKNILVTTHYSSESIFGYFDIDKIEKVLTNLMSNAFKFTPNGGTVDVSVTQTSVTQLEISVADSGIGIPPEHIGKIFDRFYQVDDSQTRGWEGTGIGLALTKELVELHKGEITVASEPGKGSIFTVRLPLDESRFDAREIVEDPKDALQNDVISLPTGDEEISQIAINDQKVKPDDQNGSRTLLVVEDNSDMRSYIRGHLGNGYTILEAEDGERGIAKAIETIPDLIISDVMMPVMSGYELCRKVKEDERTSHIPVILLTARADMRDKIDGLETGADDYLIKPFDAEELKVRIKNLIEQRQRLQKKYRGTIVLKPNDLNVTSADERFLKKAIMVVEQHLSEEKFDTEKMAQALALSRMQLHRKMKALTGRSPHEFLRTIRLHRAADLLKSRVGNISEVAYEVGFGNPAHFARLFREEFGHLPSEVNGSREK
jgi:signal transduction histidine kinase/ligand-binding sensor domain-containing protein/DNA-binding response OmpR family regulator